MFVSQVNIVLKTGNIYWRHVVQRRSYNLHCLDIEGDRATKFEQDSKLPFWLYLTYAGEDSTKESNESYVISCPYAISDIVSHTGEPTADVTICSTAVPKSSSHSINWPAASIASSSFFSLFQRASAAFFAFDVLLFSFPLLVAEVGYTNYYINVWSVVTKKSKFDMRSWVEGWNFTDTSIRTYERDPSIISR